MASAINCIPKCQNLSLQVFEDGAKYIASPRKIFKLELLQTVFGWGKYTDGYVTPRLASLRGVSPYLEGFVKGPFDYLGATVKAVMAPFAIPDTIEAGCQFCASVIKVRSENIEKIESVANLIISGIKLVGNGCGAVAWIDKVAIASLSKAVVFRLGVVGVLALIIRSTADLLVVAVDVIDKCIFGEKVDSKLIFDLIKKAVMCALSMAIFGSLFEATVLSSLVLLILGTAMTVFSFIN